ncbi:hypothetical protein [Methanocalculus sp.]|uniref:hypothetical protein n=1 Tax=Methanocalculus sp. TaxID=2004547 RepID=UPI002605A119|nr:hypothetical protein [Methanocalculus sp.]MDG6250245.1 hypothetical protein [Methanocalculus sp.]
MNKPEIIGIILIIFGILGIIGTGYSYTLGTAADAQQILQDSGAIIELHEDSVRSTGESVKEMGYPMEQVGGYMRDAGRLINMIPLVRAGDPLEDGGELLYAIGGTLNKTGYDLINTADNMRSLSENLRDLSDDIVTMMNLAMAGIGLMSFMFIITGLGFLENGSDRREITRLRLELDELKKKGR